MSPEALAASAERGSEHPLGEAIVRAAEARGLGLSSPEQFEAAGVDPEARPELLANYRELFANPYKAAELGFIDQVIRPEETRRHVARASTSSVALIAA